MLKTDQYQASNGSADVAVGQSDIQVLSRYRKADFSPGVYERVLGFVERKPPKTDTFYTLLTPFDALTWASTFVCLAMVSLAFLIIRGSADIPRSSTFHMFSIASLPLVCESVPLSWFGIRVKYQGYFLLILWLPFATLLSFSYESTLLSKLVSVSKEKPIDTFERLLESNLPMFIFKNSFTPTMLKSHPRRVIREVYQRNVLEHKSYFIPKEVPNVFQFISVTGEATALTGAFQLARYRCWPFWERQKSFCAFFLQIWSHCAHGR